MESAARIPNIKRKPGMRYIQLPNGDIKPAACIQCMPGFEPNIKCDGRIQGTEKEEYCVPCQPGFSKEKFGSDWCKRCPICAAHQKERTPCTSTTVRHCDEGCDHGYVFSPDSVSCQPCCSCHSNQAVFDPRCPRDKACRSLISDHCPSQAEKQSSAGGGLKPSPSAMAPEVSQDSTLQPSKQGVARKTRHSAETKPPAPSSPSFPRPASPSPNLSATWTKTSSTEPMRQKTAVTGRPKASESRGKFPILVSSSCSITKAQAQETAVAPQQSVEIHNHIKGDNTLAVALLTSSVIVFLMLGFGYLWRKRRQRTIQRRQSYQPFFYNTPPVDRQGRACGPHDDARSRAPVADRFPSWGEDLPCEMQKTTCLPYDAIQSKRAILCPLENCGKEIPSIKASDGISGIRFKIEECMKRHEAHDLQNFVRKVLERECDTILGIKTPREALAKVFSEKIDMKLGTLVYIFWDMCWNSEVRVIHQRFCMQPGNVPNGE